MHEHYINCTHGSAHAYAYAYISTHLLAHVQYELAMQYHMTIHAPWHRICFHPKSQVTKDRSGPKGGGRRAAGIMLMAWIVDPKMDKMFWDVVQSIDYKESVGSKSTWISQKQLYDKYGESEAEEMLDQGVVQADSGPTTFGEGYEA